jgi:hypothetical protein
MQTIDLLTRSNVQLLLQHQGKWCVSIFMPAHSKDEIHVVQADAPGAIDLLDFAAAQTLLNSGTVYALQAEEMPSDSTIAALFRYAQTNRVRIAV